VTHRQKGTKQYVSVLVSNLTKAHVVLRGLQKTRPSNLVLSPSDANLKVTAVGGEQPVVDERTAMSDVSDP
jgi:hypothetical protein